MYRLLRFALVPLCVALLAGPARADVGEGDDGTGGLRVLITGDSITQGFHGDYTWRYRLDKEFDRQGVDVDLVGSKTVPYAAGGWPGATYADPGFDQDHFAFAGTTLLQQSEWIGQEIQDQQPDLVVLASGVNDLRHGSTPTQTLANFRRWVAAARAADPMIDVIVSPVLGAVGAGLPHLPADIVAYDAMLPTAIAQLNTSDSTLTLADTTLGWDVNAFTVENLHPNPTGETHIAQRVAETMQLLGILPAAPQIYREETWTRTARATATVRDHLVTLTWPDQVISGAKMHIHHLGGSTLIAKSVYRGGTHTFTTLKYDNTYDFRLQLLRGRMVGPWGPVTRVTLRRPVRPAPVALVVVNAGGVRWSASARATSYQVQVRKAGRRTWLKAVSTTGRVLLSRNVAAARVVAVNGGGRSAARLGLR